MANRKPIPHINVPIMQANGSMELAWYLYLQFLAEGGNDGETTVSVKVNSTETTAPGTNAEVVNVGDDVDVRLDFKIPRGQQGLQGEQGQQGPAATITVGTTTTLPAGSSATVTNVGTASEAVFNFGIPKGDPGQTPTVGNGTITITQGGVTKGTFTTNQDNNTTIDVDASSGSSYHPDLFDWKWADHICNDVQWLRADTFSWQAGSKYESAYQHLADDFTNGTRTLVPEGAGIWCYIAPDGHRIVDASDTTQVQNVIDLYNTTGVAWYYIIDTVNQRFKLPRSNHNKYAETLGVVGNGISLGLNNGTQNFGLTGTSISGDASAVGKNLNAYGTNTGTSLGATTNVTNSKTFGLTTDPDNSGIIALQDQDTDQYKYLYFYVGSFTQTALENTAGLNAELFNEKADLNLANVLANIDFVVERQEPTAQNNYTWYRKYRSGWVEQGGHNHAIEADRTGKDNYINLPVTMANTNYTSSVVLFGNFDVSIGIEPQGRLATTRLCISALYTATNDTRYTAVDWQVSGMAA